MLDLTLHPLTLANLGRESRFDGRNRPSRPATIACDKVQPILALAQLCVGRSARLAGHIFDDIAPEHVLDLLLLESSLDDQSFTAVHTAARTQFCEQKLGDVLVVAVHALADFRNVRKNGLLVSFT